MDWPLFPYNWMLDPSRVRTHIRDTKLQFIIEGINPVPWAASGTGRGGGKVKSGALTAYQEALKEELTAEVLAQGWLLPHGDLDVRMWFWRALEENIRNEGRKSRGHQADTTNLFKATEDAMQGIVFANDRAVRRTMGEIVEQGPDVEPKIIIEVYPYQTTLHAIALRGEQL